MHWLDLTLDSPTSNLALEEALLDACEAGELGEVLRFWESPQHFVVLGAGSPVHLDVNLSACETAGIPILRRCSGGGTVLQGPGCLNFTLVLHKSRRAECATIDGTNKYVLGKTAAALSRTGMEIVSKGTSDLVHDNWKFSGNAQRRKKETILFHGTILYAFNLELVSAMLKEPPKQPEYREGRPHRSFIRNMNYNRSDLVDRLRAAWNCEEELIEWPSERTRKLATGKYSDQNWIMSL